jgi:hypothetical protein
MKIDTEFKMPRRQLTLGEWASEQMYKLEFRSATCAANIIHLLKNKNVDKLVII